MAARSTIIQGQVVRRIDPDQAEVVVERVGSQASQRVTLTIVHRPHELPRATRVVIERAGDEPQAVLADDMQIDLDAYVSYASALLSYARLELPPGSRLTVKNECDENEEWPLGGGMHIPVLRERSRVAVQKGGLFSLGRPATSPDERWWIELENKNLAALSAEHAQLRETEASRSRGRRRKNAVTADELKKTAAAYEQAVKDGDSPQLAVVDSLGVSRATASRRIQAARSAGLLPA